MPRNQKGGKNYKRSSHASTSSNTLNDFAIRQEGQQYGKIQKILGNNNTIVLCNDGVERICHIRGTMRKRIWLATGDIVLVSLRTTEMNVSKESSRKEKGDIIAKYSHVMYSTLKKDASVNPQLFVETAMDIVGDDIELNNIEFENSDHSDNECDNTNIDNI